MQRLISGALVLLVCGLAAAQEPAGGKTVRFQVQEGTRMNPDLSPDGRQIVFDLLSSLYIMPAQGGRAVMLTAPGSIDYRPTFSPDGKRIAFLSERDGTLNVWVMNADGSNPVNVTRQDALERPKRYRFFITPTWTPDSRAIVVSATSEISYYGSDDVLRFEVPDAANAAPTAPRSLVGRAPFDPITRPIKTAMRGAFPGEGIEHRFSADGATLFFSQRTKVGRINGERVMPQWQIGTLDVLSQRVGTLTSSPLSAFSPAPSPDGRWLVYAQRDEADAGLRLRDLRDGSDRWLLFPIDRDSIENWHTEGLISRVSFAADSRSFVTSFGGKLWRVGVPSGERQEIPFVADVTRQIAPGSRTPLALRDEPRIDIRQIEDPAPSPDGKLLAFSAQNRIWIRDARTGTVWRATSSESGTENQPAWAPDGRRIVFAGFDVRSRQGALFAVDVGSVGSKGRPARALTTRNGFYSRPAYTPDGKALVAVRADVSDDVLFSGFRAADLVVQPLNAGEQRVLAQVAPGKGYIRPQVLRGEPDRVYYYEPGSGFVSIPLAGDTAADRRVYFGLHGLGMQGGDAAGGNIADVVLDAAGEKVLIWSLDEGFGTIFTLALDRKRYASAGAAPPFVLDYANASRGGLLQLSGVAGGVQPFWSENGSSASFMLADTVLSVPAASFAKGVRASERFKIELSVPARAGVPAVLLTNARIATMRDGVVIERGDILIRGKRIEAVGVAGSVAAPGAHRIDVAGATILPGLIEAHGHETFQQPLAPPNAGEWYLANRLAYGVTTIFDPASELLLYKNAALVESGEWAGARVLTTGPLFEPYRQLGSLEDARELVRRNSRYYRSAAVKSYDIGGSLNRRWIAQAARDEHINVAVESEGSLNYTVSLILEGYQHLAHGFAMPVYADFRKLIIEAGAGSCFQFGTLRGEGGPSSSFYFLEHALDRDDAKVNRFMPPDYQFQWWRHISIDPTDNVFRYYSERLGKFIDEGGHVSLGDHGTFLGQGMQWEVLALGNAMSPAKALHAATADAARLIGLEAELGTLEPGKKADLIVLDANPLEKLSAISSVRYTMRDGELFEASTLKRVWPASTRGFEPWWQGARPSVRPGAERSGGVNPF